MPMESMALASFCHGGSLQPMLPCVWVACAPWKGQTRYNQEWPDLIIPKKGPIHISPTNCNHTYPIQNTKPLRTPKYTPKYAPNPPPKPKYRETIKNNTKIGDRYDWTTGAPHDGNEWQKYRVVPRAHPLRTLLNVYFILKVWKQRTV